MTYKLYLTIEMPGSFTDKEAAMDAAVTTLQNAVTVFDKEARVLTWAAILRGDAIQARVFETGKITHGDQHAFLVDIHDGAI